MFSPRVYYRMFETHNAAYWPSQVFAGAFGLLILHRLLRGINGYDRIIFVTLGVIWMWIAWSFFWHRYSQINWPVAYVAPVFALEGLLLVWIGLAQTNLISIPKSKVLYGAGVFAFAMALFAYPLITSVAVRPWRSAEVFGVAPDPTAIATLAVLLFAPFSFSWLLFVIPIFFCILTGLTHWTMSSSEFLLAPVLASIVVCASIAQWMLSSASKSSPRKM